MVPFTKVSNLLCNFPFLARFSQNIKDCFGSCHHQDVNISTSVSAAPALLQCRATENRNSPWRIQNTHCNSRSELACKILHFSNKKLPCVKLDLKDNLKFLSPDMLYTNKSCFAVPSDIDNYYRKLPGKDLMPAYDFSWQYTNKSVKLFIVW